MPLVTKQPTLGRETVVLRPSRIRRDPVRPDTRKTVVATRRSRERDIWAAMLGVSLVAASVAAIVIGISAATNKGEAASVPAAPPLKFDFCSGTRSADCVVDGGTFYLGSERISISGMEAPKIGSAACSAEVRLGVDASVRLRRMLNDGAVAFEGSSFGRPSDAATTRKVLVNGVDVARVMIASGLAHDPAAGKRSWC